MTNNFISRLQLYCAFAFALVGLLAQAATADEVFTGIGGGTFHETTTNFSAGVTTGGINNSFSVGGEGSTAPIAFSTGGGMGEVGGDYLNPILKAKSTGFADEGVYTRVGMMGTYQYVGTSAGTVTYNYALDAILTEQDPDTAAFLRYNGALITGADFYSTSYVDFFESSGTVEDSFSITSSVDGILDESGSISFDANPGDVFYLTTLLAPYAGRDGAIADAFSTATGSFSVSGGGSIVSLNAIPEPAAGTVMALVGLLGFVARRR